MKMYYVLEGLRRLVTWPFRLLVSPIWILVGLLATHWDIDNEREYFKKSILNLIKPI